MNCLTVFLDRSLLNEFASHMASVDDRRISSVTIVAVPGVAFNLVWQSIELWLIPVHEHGRFRGGDGVMLS